MSQLIIDAAGVDIEMIECDACGKTILSDEDSHTSGHIRVNNLYETCWSGIFCCVDDPDCQTTVVERHATEITVEIT